MTRVVAVALQKGGVGKSTTAQHLGHGLAANGYRVLLVDLDPQHSLTRRYDQTHIKYTMADVLGVGAEGEELTPLADAIIPTHVANLSLAPSNKRLSRSDIWLGQKHGEVHRVDRVLNDQRLPYDYVVLDTPPGDSSLLLAALAAADDLVVPVKLAPMGFEGFEDIDERIVEARGLQDLRGNVRLAFRCVVPTFYQRGTQVSDIFLDNLRGRNHPDYAGESLPVSLPVPQTVHFEKCTVPRPVQGNGGKVVRSLVIWESAAATTEDIVQRATDAYMDVVSRVAAYG